MKYHTIVVGLGSCGMYAASHLTKKGKKVIVIQKGPRGTTCIRTGCMPSKALFVPAHYLSKSYGLVKPQIPNIEKLFSQMRKQRASFVRYRLQSENNIAFEIKKGDSTLLDKNTIQLGNETFTAKHIVLSTGSSVFVPFIPGLAKTPYWTSDTVFEQENIKGKSITILGGGVIGCEMAQFFNSIGFTVTIITRTRPLLKNFDEDMACVLEKVFIKKGIKIIYNPTIQNVSYKTKFTVQFEKKKITSEYLLVTTGRTPNHINGAKDVLQFSNGRIKRNSTLQTSQKNIYTGGDESGIPLLHEARQEGEYIAKHILGEVKKPYQSNKVQIAFTYPHIACVGKHEFELKKGTYLKSEMDFDEGRSIIEHATQGKIKLLTDLKGRVIGCSVVNDNADHLIQMMTSYVQYKLPITELTDCYHPTQQEVFLDLKDDILSQLEK